MPYIRRHRAGFVHLRATPNRLQCDTDRQPGWRSSYGPT